MIGRYAALLSVSFYALSVVIVRRMRLGESNLTFSFYGFVASIMISGALLLTNGAKAVDRYLLHFEPDRYMNTYGEGLTSAAAT